MDVHNSSDGNKRKQWAIYIYIFGICLSIERREDQEELGMILIC